MARHAAVRMARLAVPILLALPAGCAGMMSLEDLLATAGGVYGGGADRSGEIRMIDTRRQEIELSSTWGRDERIRYDGRTEVLYGQRRYSVRDLERGDYVRMNVEADRNGRVYARRIQVQQSVHDRDTRSPGSVYGRVQRFDGSVGRIDVQRGWFELYHARGDVSTVTLPYEPARSLRDRFRRLRRGDRVRIEGELLNASRIELLRFL